MLEKNFKLRIATRYFMGGGGGGSSNIGSPYGRGGGNRNFRQEQPTLTQGYGFQQDQYNQFVQNNPLLNAANQSALGYNTDLNAGMPSLWNPSAEEERNWQQQARTTAAAQGTAHTTGALGSELLNRQSNLLGRASQIQGLQTGGLNQLLGTLGGGVSAFGSLTNPILGYISNLFSGNQQTQIAQAQINAQQNAAGQAKGGSTIGGAISAIGPILGAVLSDERLKTKVEPTPLSISDVPLKTWEYKTRPGVRFIGAMAQDIEKVMPSAVGTDPVSGVKFVDSAQFPVIQISALKAA